MFITILQAKISSSKYNTVTIDFEEKWIETEDPDNSVDLTVLQYMEKWVVYVDNVKLTLTVMGTLPLVQVVLVLNNQQLEQQNVHQVPANIHITYP